MRYNESVKKIRCGEEQIKFLKDLYNDIDEKLVNCGVSKKIREDCLKKCRSETTKVRNKVVRSINENMTALNDIYSVINKVENPDYAQFLTYKYINGYTYDEIEELMYISRTCLFDINREALSRVQELITEKNKDKIYMS